MFRPLDSCCGPWSGFWLMGWTRGNMKLKLHFEKGCVSGDGSDLAGAFGISGIYSPETNQVIFSKVYPWHSIDYSGLWDGQLIYGKWVLHDDEYGEAGEFEIWPDDGDEGLKALSGIGENVDELPEWNF